MRAPLPPAPLALLAGVLLAASCSSSPPPDAPPAPADVVEEAALAPEDGAPGEGDTAPFRDPRAEEVARAMAEALGKAANFSLHVEAWSDEATAGGSLTSLPSESRILVRRPDGLFVERTSERGLRRFWYDGRRCTVLDVARNLYAGIDAPPTIDATVDLLADRYGVVTPLADLLVADPWESYDRVAERVEYLGTQAVRGVDCHHLSFSAPWLRWQIWIAAEGPPLPRRVQITYADEPGDPRFLAYLDDWKLGEPAVPGAFAFQAPPGAREIPLAPLPKEEDGGDDGDAAADETR